MSDMAQKTEYLSLEKLRKQFTDYSTIKTSEIEEARVAWRYYHAAQLTAKQLETYRKRRQPAITFPRIGRKIDGLVGTVRRLRTDPKAFARTEAQEAGADIATQVVRYILDSSGFEDIEAECVRDAAVHGIGVAEMTLQTGDRGDPDIGFVHVDPRTYFYDARSTQPDFGDRRFDGTYKWVGADELDEIVPGASRLVADTSDGSYSTAFDTDRDILWRDVHKRYRLVDHWYIRDGKWRFCLHVGMTKLAEGDSPFIDHLGRSISKYNPFAAYIDHDGDHYGFVRAMKGPQDAMNQHRSKALHIMNTRQVFARKGVFDNIDKARREVATPDGFVEYNGERGDFEVSSPSQEFLQQTQYYQDAKAEIENFGPNPALIGTGVSSRSGRAYAMMQQSALAELGPFLKNYRMWKLRLYRSGWTAAQQFWTGERWIRVTDDDELARYIQINGLGIDEYGLPTIINALGALDVDIVLDEGPDTETVMGDAYDTLSALAQNGEPVPPEVIIEASALPRKIKDKMLKSMEQPETPEAQQARQIQVAGAVAKIQKTQAEAARAAAQAEGERVSSVKTAADAQHTQAQTTQTQQDIRRRAIVDTVDELTAGRVLGAAVAQTIPRQY